MPPLDYRGQSFPTLGKLRRWAPFVCAVVGVWIFLALHLLPVDVMGERMWNEADVLPLARQDADPDWLPHDWYLNEDAGYRFAFQRFAAPLVRELGFIPAALVGRAVCYALVAAGLAIVAGAIGLRPWMLILAVVVFLSLHGTQSTAGGEWFVGGFEAKAVAWGLVLLAIGAALHRRYALAALLAGLAASFHVLVGGWATLVLWVWLLVIAHDGRSLADRDRLRTLGWCALGTAIGAIGAVAPLWSHLGTSRVVAQPSPNYVYVHLRLPHHLVPASWQPIAWLQLTMFAALLLWGFLLLCRPKLSPDAAASDADARWRRPDMRFIALIGIALVPFLGGLLVAPWDRDGILLRYYPFRVGGVLLPLGAYLLAALVIQRSVLLLPTGPRRTFAALVLTGLAFTFAATTWRFERNLHKLAYATAPGGSRSGADGEPWVAACDAVRALTPEGAIIVTPPAGGADFTWRSGRARVANFKLMPQNPRAIVEWFTRMRDLAGGADLAALPGQFPKYDAEDFRDAVTAGYKSLSTREASALMRKYNAHHFLTTADHELHLPVLYENDRYTLYAAAVLPTPNPTMFGKRNRWTASFRAHVRSG